MNFTEHLLDHNILKRNYNLRYSFKKDELTKGVIIGKIQGN